MAKFKANPKPEVPEVTPALWPLQDQLRFLPWIASTFEYSDDAHAEAEGRVLMDQQKFVRDYLQHDSPYRGLLLLHSLGVGKTCAAIAAAEALRPSRTGGVFVMTTKMLHASFAKEVPLCAAPSLQRRQRWRRVPATDPLAAATASKMTAKMLKAHGGVWVPQGRDEEGQEYVEYDDLDATEQEGIDSQVDAIIDATFHFVHYNGLTKERVDQMFQGGTNPFDGAVVIIDEVHNFVSRVMNKRLVAPLYERLLDAVDCKVILLSGTPIVNRTAELAYLINLVQGRTVIHVLQLIDESSMEAIQEALDAADVSRIVQEVSYEPSTRRVRVVFAPVGFEMSADNAGMVHRVRDDDERPTSMTSPSIERVTRALGDAHIRVKARNSMTALPLPDDVDDFDAHFVDWEQGTIVNPVLLQRRIVGAVSSYSLRDKTFFASVSPINIVQQCPVSGCRGFLSTQYQCGMCSIKVCPDCREVIGSPEHTCDPDIVASIQAIRTDSKGCPACGCMIYRIYGCNQMYCTAPGCNTAFCWRTLRILDRQRIHNPHYTDYLQHQQQQHQQLQVSIPVDVGMPDSRTLMDAVMHVHGFQSPDRKVRQEVRAHLRSTTLFAIYNCTIHINMVEMRWTYPAAPDIVDPAVNLELRRSYLIGTTTEKTFKETLQKREKRRKTKDAIHQILAVVYNVASDLFREVVVQRSQSSIDDAVRQMSALRVYTNDSLKLVRKRYGAKVPEINEAWYFPLGTMVD
ncbi:hypothetical protein TSOC_013909 [Tetrabaena socialis]|uniref:Helicase ATP-binding domain-containing protein n=1 Tax=Tetrabaena socialis TaxID=47790 RepID=A0A2J7ZJ22_9CHLO|nr:hypothetical protein TSOC_013909 [Tetrabaena socialis]|eukprot:PNH00269.1 hypothetical protein TSOC_013909 [Tetrabaena socialis]